MALKKTLHQLRLSKIWRNTLSCAMNQVYRHWRLNHFKIPSSTKFSRNTEKPFHKLPSSGESHTLLCCTFYCVWSAIFFKWGILKSFSRENLPTPRPEIPKKVLMLLIRDQGGILALPPKWHGAVIVCHPRAKCRAFIQDTPHEQTRLWWMAINRG